METLYRDVKYGCRMLARKPGFTAVAVIALALGIGANSALFSVVNGVLLRPLALHHAERIACLFEENREHGQNRGSASAPNFADWREQSHMFEHMAAYRVGSGNLSGFGDPERAQYVSVSEDFFKTLQVSPLAGRSFEPRDYTPGGERLALLSYGFWQRRFGAVQNIVGRSFKVDGLNVSVVGVMPREAQFPGGAQFWMPLQSGASTAGRRSQSLLVIGRLKSGADPKS